MVSPCPRFLVFGLSLCNPIGQHGFFKKEKNKNVQCLEFSDFDVCFFLKKSILKNNAPDKLGTKD